MKGERVKKKILLAAVLLVTAIVPSLAGAAPDDVKGPACADAVSGRLFYTADKQARTIFEVAAPSCAFVTYSLVVFDEEGDTEPLIVFSEKGDGSGQLDIGGTVPDTDSTICVYVETSVGNGNHVFDRAPDAGCVELEAGGDPAGYEFN